MCGICGEPLLHHRVLNGQLPNCTLRLRLRIEHLEREHHPQESLVAKLMKRVEVLEVETAKLRAKEKPCDKP